ncbi:unnamed protein product [Diatraea saccharalis]|uniref:Major facilitator superfamily (MFS) profile domain-containing protein n=1 Tax=Diatraea saccharalis TaxID=40085 RepID=A0A9P0FZ33_9NEOP|nr:unnamed protein product [Diatraea saccharalis]
MTDKIINENNKDNKDFGHTRLQWIVVMIVSMMMLNYGMETGWLSPMTKILTSDLSPTGSALSSSEFTWVSSITALTAVCVVSLYAYITDAFGRKAGVLAVGIPQLLSWAMKLFATNTTLLIISRAVAGFASAGCFIALPIYVREISQDSIRGAAVALLMLMQNLGCFFMYLIGGYLDYYTILGISLSVSLISTVLMVFAPESPAHLVKKEKFEEAAKTLALLRGVQSDHKSIQLEMNEMKNDEEYYKSLPHLTFVNIFKNKAWRRGLLRIILVNTAQSGSGIFAILTYVWVILSSTGASGDPDLQSLVVPVLLLFGSLVSMVWVQKFGRKVILVSMHTLIAAAMTCLGTYLVLQHNGFSPPDWIPLFAIAASVWAYAAGVLPLFYVIVSEMFHFQVRSKLMGCIVSYSWFVSSIQLLAFIPVSEMFGIYTMFFIYGFINIVGAIAALVLLPETKGKTIEEIEKILSG